ncbi:hypothetical protein BS78_03G404000 [Paspalum vaginatum]|nr:hypothetical protein BS78_03G404000 [Paspalum vaginatum]KAJ1287096.1 hypothetical protein BS78_03G404000 [Paspalum vaginatum]KAJ1287097.1 hypothetical protein BS78_03G404000 [Paspalum vaginatum]
MLNKRGSSKKEMDLVPLLFFSVFSRRVNRGLHLQSCCTASAPNPVLRHPLRHLRLSTVPCSSASVERRRAVDAALSCLSPRLSRPTRSPPRPGPIRAPPPAAPPPAPALGCSRTTTMTPSSDPKILARIGYTPENIVAAL